MLTLPYNYSMTHSVPIDRYGWISEDYLNTVNNAVNNIKRVIDGFGDKYYYLFLADHSGHDRILCAESTEDMTIFLYFIGETFEKGKVLVMISILDVVPTIVDIFGIRKPND